MKGNAHLPTGTIGNLALHELLYKLNDYITTITIYLLTLSLEAVLTPAVEIAILLVFLRKIVFDLLCTYEMH